jgi:hypothetical protein
VARGYLFDVKLLRSAAAVAAAKVIYDQARRPENQAQVKAFIERMKASRGTSGA